MGRKLSINPVGVSVSALLAVPYTVVVLASLVLVGMLKAGSWPAAFLGIGWETLIGFELGLLGVMAAGLALAVVLVPAFNAIWGRVAGRSPSSARPNQTGDPSVPSWAFRLLAACLVLPALAFVVLRVLAPIWLAGLTPDGVGPGVIGPAAGVQPVNLGATFNTALREAEPSFTADGQTMYFNCDSGDICVSHLVGTWQAGSWTAPERLGAPISTEYEEVEPVINAAGDSLYFTSNRPDGRLKGIPFLSPIVNVFEIANSIVTSNSDKSLFGGLGLQDVWVSYQVDGVWSEPQNMNDVAGEPHINTPFADHCLFFSADGDEAFWTSTRPGGFGSDDIWTSRRVDGTWTEGENLGLNVNGQGSDHTSIPTPDGRSLYVTTTHAEGFGGEDIYFTTRGAEGTWGPLVNLGPAVNGPGDDRCPAWTPDLTVFLFDSVREGGFGGRDIWWVRFEDVMGFPPAAASAGDQPSLLAEGL